MTKKHSGKSFVLVGALAIAALLTLAYIGFKGLGRQRFERGSLMTEAHLNVALLARGIAACAESSDATSAVRSAPDAGARPRGLPPTSPRVPESIAELRGEYTSTPEDWKRPAFACAKFAIEAPQHFQYRWELRAPDSGLAQAAADLDGDGRAEVFLHASVSCRSEPAGLKCEIGPVEATPWESAR